VHLVKCPRADGPLSQPCIHMCPRLNALFWVAAATVSTMGDEESVTAIKEALIANEPKTAPIDPRFPNTNQVSLQERQTTF